MQILFREGDILICEEIYNILPPAINKAIGEVEGDYIQEIRIKIDREVILIKGNREYVLDYKAKIGDIKWIMSKMMNYSLYAFEEELKQGYITIRGGHRVGICGSYVLDGENIKTLKDVSSLNIRFCREIIGCSDKIMNYITTKGEPENTIIISPPKCGKTTLIRDIARNFSSKFKVCIIDERSEIGGMYLGKSYMDLGLRSDILDNCPKAEGIMMAIRSMSPDIIVCDEIGTQKDIESIMVALCCGIKIITTIHGKDEEDLYKRLLFKELLGEKGFSKGVVLRGNKVGQVSYIFDFNTKIKYQEG